MTGRCMKPKITKLIINYSSKLSQTDQHLFCRELSAMQRPFEWNKWVFGLSVLDHPEIINQLSKPNILKMFVVISEKAKQNPGFFNQIFKSGILGELVQSLEKQIEVASSREDIICKIDGNFDFRADTPPNQDPDQKSATLRNYHKLLWSKLLPNGQSLELSGDLSGKYLYHNSDLGEFNLTSDSITNSYRHNGRMKDIVNRMPLDYMTTYYRSVCTIGGYTLFPGGQRKGMQTINQARGCNHRIVDRFDLTLECIRRFYLNTESPLKKTFDGYRDFFNLFQTFEGYINFFHFEDLVSNDYSKVKFLLPFDDSFPLRPFPKDFDQYQEYLQNTLSFINSRTERILDNQ